MTLTRRTFLAASAASLAIPVRAQAPTASELGTSGMTAIADDVWVKRIGTRNWLITATAPIDGGLIYPSNGLIHDGSAGLILIDPGWNPAHGEALIDFCRKRIGRPPRGAIVTHFHSDRTGAVPALNALGIDVHANPMTMALARGLDPAEAPASAPFATPVFGLETYYPGHAHSPDNIVVWDADARLLFGGCMIKSATSSDLGNLGDASVPSWSEALERVAGRYPRAKIVVPGHGDIAGDGIGRTRELLAKPKGME
jgi:metallo-beta-lactamase class B